MHKFGFDFGDWDFRLKQFWVLKAILDWLWVTHVIARGPIDSECGRGNGLQLPGPPRRRQCSSSLRHWADCCSSSSCLCDWSARWLFGAPFVQRFAAAARLGPHTGDRRAAALLPGCLSPASLFVSQAKFHRMFMAAGTPAGLRTSRLACASPLALLAFTQHALSEDREK